MLCEAWLAHWLIGSSVQAIIYLCLMDIASGMDYLHSLGVLHGMLSMLCSACYAATLFCETWSAQRSSPENFGVKPPLG